MRCLNSTLAMVAASAAAVLLFSTGNAGAAQTFKVWQAACAQGACATETKSKSGQSYLRVSRMAGRSAPWHVSLLGLEGRIAENSPIGFWVNGSPALRLALPESFRVLQGNYFVADNAALVTLFPGLRAGNRLAVTYTHKAGKRHTLSFSLNGLEKALAWIDAQQRRDSGPASVSGPGTLGRKLSQGQRPQVPQSASPDKTSLLPLAILEAHGSDDECDFQKRNSQAFEESIVQGGLDSNNTLFLLPCFSGAYNVVFRIYIYDKRYPDDVRPEYFAAYSDQRGWFGKPDLINAVYDASSKTITALEKGRGIGDCGSLVRYRWTADGLRLLTYKYWGRCDGSRMPEDWPVIYDYDKDERQ